MAWKITLLVCLILYCQISCVTAASECTGAILASVFGTIGTILVIAAIAALVWYCCRKNSGTLSSRSSVDTGSEPEISLGTKSKGGDIGLNGHGTPVTFSHRYSEEAPSAAYNTRGVVNPAFGGSHDVHIDMPPHHEGEFKIDMDGSPSMKRPSHKGDVKVDMSGHSGIKPPSGKGDVKIDMDWDPSLDKNLTDGDRPDLNLPEGKRPGIDLPESELSASGLSGRSLPGADADVVIQRPAKPTFNVNGPKNLETIDVDLDRPEQGGLGLLIARDKTLPPPALFVNEVTPGGIAAKTGLMDKGDKIIGINGESIEGMPYDRAMSLLRDDAKPKLQLTLLKNSLDKGKDASLDLPKGPLEESCKIDMEPTLEAGVPSFEIEGLQGDAPDLGEIDVNTERPGFDVSGPNVNSNIDLNDPSSDLNLPSPKTKRGKCFSCVSSGYKDEPYSKGKATAGLDLDKPNVEESIDMEADGKMVAWSGPDGKGSGLHAVGPNVSFPSTRASGNLSGPSVEGDDFQLNPKVQLHSDSQDIKTPDGNVRTRVSGANVDVSEVEGPERKAGIPSSELDLPIKKKKRGNCFSCAGGTSKEEPYKKRKGNGAIDFNRPDVDGSMEMRANDSFDISSTRNYLGGDTTNFQPKDLELHASAPDVDIPKSGEQGNIEISGPNVSSPSPHASAKFPERSLNGDHSINAPHIDTRGEQMKSEISGLDVEFPAGKFEDRRAQSNIPSADLAVPSTKKKRSSCFKCAGDGDKDDSYRKTKGTVGYDFSGPDGSLGMKKVDKFDLSRSSPDFEKSGINKELGLRAAGPDFTLDGENRGISPGTSGIAVNTSGPEIDAPDVSSEDVDFDVSGPDVGVSRTKPVGLHKNTPNIDTPRPKLGPRISGPEVDVSTKKIRDIKEKPDFPAADLKFSSSKKKGGNCLPCTGGADKDEPYRKTKKDAQFDLNVSEVHGSTGRSGLNIDTKKPSVGIDANAPELEIEKPTFSKPDATSGGTATVPGFDINTPDIAVSAQQPRSGLDSPEFDVPKARGEGAIDVDGPAFSYAKPKISEPSLGKTNEGFNIPSIDTPETRVKSPEFGVPKLGASGGIDAGPNVNTPDFHKTKSKLQTEIPKPNVDVPSANFRGPEATLQGPSADLPPVSKRKLRGNCLSCTGGADKDEPYRRAKGNTQFDIGGKNLDGSVEMKTSGIGEPAHDINGRATGPDFEIDTPDTDVSAQTPRIGVKSPEFDVPKARGEGAIDVDGPAFSYDKPKISEPSIGQTNEGFDIKLSNRDINTPDIDPSIDTRDTRVKSPEFGVPKLRASGEVDAGANVNSPDFNKTKSKLQTEISKPNVDVPSANFRGLEANLQSASPDLPPVSKRKLRGNCLSCTGGADKDEPYRRAKGNTKFDIGGKNPDGSVEMKTSGIGEPTHDINGRATGPDFDIDTPDTDVSAQTPRIGLKSSAFGVPKAGGEISIDVDGPAFSFDKPKMSEPSVGKTNEGFDIPSSNRGINTSDIDASVDTPDTGVKLPEFGVPKIGASGEIDAGANVNSPDFHKANSELQTEISKPNADVPSGTFRGPEATLQGPSADLPPVSKRKLRGNCLSCTGGADKDEPYRRATGNTQFDIGGKNLDGSVEMKSSGIGEPAHDINGRATGPDFETDTPDTYVSAQTPRIGLKSPTIDVPKAGGEISIDVDGLAFSYDKPKISEPSVGKTNEGFDIPSSNRGMNTPNIDAPVSTPDAGVCSPEFSVPKLGASGEIDARPNINAPDLNKPKGKLTTEISKPNVEVPSGTLRGPDTNFQGPSVDLPSASKRKLRGNCLSCTAGADKDEPYGRAKGNTQFDFQGPDLDGSLEMNGIGEPKVDIDREATSHKFDIDTPDIDISSKKAEIDLMFSGFDATKVGEINITGPDLSCEEPEVSGPSLDRTEEYGDIGKPDFGINIPHIETTNKPNNGFNPPGLDIPTTKGAGQIDVSGADFSYEKTNISGPSFGQSGQGNDVPRLGIDINTPQDPEDFDIPKPDIYLSSEDGDIAFTSASRKDLDIEANLPDIEVSNIKTGLELDTSGLDKDVPGVENNLEIVEPSVSTLHADTSECKPTVGLNMNGLDVDHAVDVDFDLNPPDLDVKSKQRHGVDLGELDISDSDYSFPPIGDKVEPCEPLEIKEGRGKDFDSKFNWGINTSTPKAPEATKQLIGLPRSETNLESSPVEDDISVVNTYDTLDLHSTPQPVPSVAFDEPHSLQRYDEIRPEMELRLLPPTEMRKSDQSFEFEIPDTNDDKAKNSWKPGSMKLVKVEENVTVCSASVEENESHSPINRTLTLDREIRQKIEVVFPEEEKQKRSSSSSSSSSSDSDGQKEEKPKRKKKSRLLEAFRKSSSSSASSKEGRTSLKQKEKERKQSESSSSSSDEGGERQKSSIKCDVTPSSREGQAPLRQYNRESKPSTSSSSSDTEQVGGRKRLSKDDVLLVKTTEEKKTRPTSTSSSSDDESSFLHGKGLPKRKRSKSSSSSDKENHNGNKQLFLVQTTFEEKKLEKPVPSITEVQQDMPAVVSPSIKPVSDLNFAVDKPEPDIKPKERKISTSSSSDEESKSSMVYKVEYSMYQQQHVVEPESDPDNVVLSVADMQVDTPGVVLNSVKPADPDFLIMSDMGTKPKERKTSSSSSSSSNAEDVSTADLTSVKSISPKSKEQKNSSSSSSDEETKSPVVYEVQDRMLQQQSVLEPESGHKKSMLSASDMKEGAPEAVLHSAEPEDPEFKFTLDTQINPKGRKSSTSSSSSSDSIKPADQYLILSVEKPHYEIKPKEWKSSMTSPSDAKSRSPVAYKAEYTTYQQQYPTEPEGESDQQVPSVEEVQEDSSEVESHSVDHTELDFTFMPDSRTNIKERKSSTSSSSSSDAEPDSDSKAPQTTNVHDPKAKVDTSLPQKHFVSYNIEKPDYPEKKEKQSTAERKSSTSSSSEEIDYSSHSLDLTVYRYETVHHVIAPDYPPTEQETNSPNVQENSFVVVSRSFKKPSLDIWSSTRENQEEPQLFLSSTDVQFSEPATDFAYHLEYPFNHPEVEKDKSAHIQEEGIVPVFKTPSVDRDISCVSAQLASPDEDGTVDQNSHSSPTWNIHAHTFETVYQVTIPDSPSTDENSLEIHEMTPTVVTRSVKRTSPVLTSEYDNLEEEPHLFTSSIEVQFSEPGDYVEIDYPKTDKALTTDEPDVTLTDEEWIIKHTVKKEAPDISTLLAGFEHLQEEAQQSSDSGDKTKDEEISPSEKSPKDIVRRGSSSRLWDLMQGYLIEQPIVNDGESNTELEPEKSVQQEEPKLEIRESVSTVESSAPLLSQQTETVHQVTQHASNVVTYKILLDDNKPSKEVTKSITKVESSVLEVTPTVYKVDPVNFEVNVGEKTPVVKEHTTSHWRKQISVPVDVDDDEDPWMRHYSKGLQRGTSYQVVSTKSPEAETSLLQSRSLSLSKVPHVKGVKTSTEKERERTRYSIESRTRTEPTVYSVTTERRPLLRELEAIPRVRTNENMFSIKDGKIHSPRTQTGTTKEESPRGTSGSGQSVQDLRSFWDK